MTTWEIFALRKTAFKSSQIHRFRRFHKIRLLTPRSATVLKTAEMTQELFALKKSASSGSPIQMKKLQMRQITIISRPTLRLIRDKNPHCLSGGNKLNTNKSAYFPPETACGSTTKGSQFGSFVKRNFYFLAKRSSLDFFDYFLSQNNPPKADR